MRVLLKTIPLFFVACMFLLSSCEQDSLEQPAELATTPSFISLEDAVTVHPDGSYSYELTGEQMLNILAEETSGDLPTEADDLADAFGRLVMERQNEKEGKEQQKTITFSCRYRVETILTIADLGNIGNWIITGGGIGGLIPNVTPNVSFNTSQSRIFGSFFLMVATVDANDNTGTGVFSDADSSADIFSCTPTRRNPRRVVGRANIAWNVNGTFSGDADVRCRSGLVIGVPQEPIGPAFE